MATNLAKTVQPFEEMGTLGRGWHMIEKAEMPGTEHARRWAATGATLKNALRQMSNEQQLSIFETELMAQPWVLNLKPEAKQIFLQTIAQRRSELSKR